MRHDFGLVANEEMIKHLVLGHKASSSGTARF